MGAERVLSKGLPSKPSRESPLLSSGIDGELVGR